MAKRYDKNELEKAVKENVSIAGVLRAIGRSGDSGGMYRNIQKRIKVFGISTSHFTGSVWNKGKTFQKKWNIDNIRELLKKFDSEPPHVRLKKKLLDLGILKNKCRTCGQKPWWCKKLLVLQLDHINGNRWDWRLKNLRILCPNCHSQTETFGSKRLAKIKRVGL
jgi:5-methylcytosine-specific restriction endonuclease McrA